MEDNMRDVEEMLAALAARVTALEAENERLRALVTPKRSPRDTTPSRRGLLVGGAGLFGAMIVGAGASTGQANAAASHLVEAVQYEAPILIGARLTAAPKRGGGYHWARFTWDMNGAFVGDQPPAVLAAVSDDYHGADERAEPTVAVALRREDGIWHADILVNHVGHLATEVTLNAVAFGSKR
jgi:hypothetical protein